MAQFAWRPSHGGKEPSGTVAITADGWLLRLYGIKGVSKAGCFWEIHSPDRVHMTGGHANSVAAAKREVSVALGVDRVRLRQANDPIRKAAFDAWRADNARALAERRAQLSAELKAKSGPQRPGRT